MLFAYDTVIRKIMKRKYRYKFWNRGKYYEKQDYNTNEREQKRQTEVRIRNEPSEVVKNV